MTEEVKPDTIQIDNLDHFVRIMVEWHSTRVTQTKHLIELPEGAQFQIGEDEPLTLSGSTLAAFKFGVELALMQLGTLPFSAEVEEETPADA